MVRLIARRVGPVLLDADEAERLRAAAAFVLGKTHLVEGLEAILEAISAPGQLPSEVARQCAFAFDALAESCGATGWALGPETVGHHFVRHNVPWDAASRRVVVNDL